MITKNATAKPKLLLVGCGDIALRLVNQLKEDSFEFYGLRRNTENLPAQINPIACDLNDHQTLNKKLETSFDYVVVTLTPNQRDEEGYRRCYVDNLQALLKALQSSSTVKHLLFVSSTSVYHQRDGEWVDENTDTLPQHFRGSTILKAEKICSNSSIPTTIVRFSGIYGPGRKRLINQVREGRWSLEENSWTNRIHSEDAAAVLVWCLMRLINDLPLDSLYLANDCEPVIKSTVCEWLAGEMKLNLPTNKDKIKNGKAHQRGDLNKRCSNAKLLAAGFNFKYPSFREGYKVLLAEE